MDVSEPSQIPCQGEAAGAIYFYLQDQGFSFLLHSEMRPVAGGMGVRGVKKPVGTVFHLVFGWPTGLFLQLSYMPLYLCPFIPFGHLFVK